MKREREAVASERNEKHEQSSQVEGRQRKRKEQRRKQTMSIK
jgi:hypothetical protein